MRRLGIFGGTFNPVHIGHLRAAEEVREALCLHRVVWVPSARPPHKEETGDEIVSAEHRLSMVRLAIEGNPAFELLDAEVNRPGPSYTLMTLEALKRDRPDDQLFFLIGLDAFAELGTWHRPRDLFLHAHFAVISRPGRQFASLLSSPFVAVPEGSVLERLEGEGGSSLACRCTVDGGLDVFLVRIPGLDVSSTDIRQRLRAGDSVRYLLPAPVESYILGEGLYSNTRRTGP